MTSRRSYNGNARFIELGSIGAPFRSLINVDHITNVRFEQKISDEPVQYDDNGEMTAPPQQILEGWNIIILLGHGAGGQNILFPDEELAVDCYNQILDMIGGAGCPMSRLPKLEPEPVPSEILGPNGQGVDLDALNDESLPGEAPDLTDEEFDQLENPEIDVDVIADAVEDGLGKES